MRVDEDNNQGKQLYANANLILAKIDTREQGLLYSDMLNGNKISFRLIFSGCLISIFSSCGNRI